MKLVKNILTNNDCYRAGRKITVRGLMLHSVGCNQPNASVFLKNWNRPGVDACVHAFIDGNTGTVYQTLPWNHRGWHGGGSSNNTHIGVEMCEPAQIKYTGGSSFKCSDKVAARKVAERTYKAAVELFAYLCKEYRLNPLTQIVSHAEGYKKGIATNHGDPEHLWRGLGMGYTMDGFRRDVKAAMNGTVPEVPSEKPSAKPTPKLSVDGSHGPATIRAKQRFYDCAVVDGEISGQPLSNKPYCYAFVKGQCTEFVSDKSAEGSMVVMGEQKYLKKKGYYKGSTDGFYGPQTVRAKQQFLKDKGYYKGSIDGSYGPETCKADQKWLNANYNDWK